MDEVTPDPRARRAREVRGRCPAHQAAPPGTRGFPFAKGHGSVDHGGGVAAGLLQESAPIRGQIAHDFGCVECLTHLMEHQKDYTYCQSRQCRALAKRDYTYCP